MDVNLVLQKFIKESRLQSSPIYLFSLKAFVSRTSLQQYPLLSSFSVKRLDVVLQKLQSIFTARRYFEIQNSLLDQTLTPRNYFKYMSVTGIGGVSEFTCKFFEVVQTIYTKFQSSLQPNTNQTVWKAGRASVPACSSS